MRLHSATLVLLIAPVPLSAQRVRGTVVERSDSTPLSGVVVQLLDTADLLVARALTSETGAFRLVAPGGGRYRLRTLRIGYRPAVSAPFQVPASGEAEHDVALASIPMALDTVHVTSRSLCRLAGDSATATHAVWDQIRTALTAAELTSRARNFAAVTVTYERTTDAAGERVLDQQSRVHSGFTLRPWRSLPADVLRRDGYVVAEADGGRTYFAPDLEVLASSTFLDDHCFSLTSGPDPGRLGIAFVPVRSRSRVPEIAGTVWVDRRSSELRAMVFRYVNIPFDVARGGAGGEMEFVRMRNNAWAISRWNIRMPRLEQRFTETSGVPGERTAAHFRVAELRIAGGQLALVRRDADTLWAQPARPLAGLLLDSASGAPIAHGRVVLRGTGLRATSDTLGRFVIPDVLPGEYRVDVGTPGLDSLEHEYSRAVQVTDITTPLPFRVPSADVVAARSCERWESDRGDPLGLVVGTLTVGGDSRPRPNTAVTVEWVELGLQQNESAVLVSRRPIGVQGRTDGAGVYRFCGIPVDRDFTIRSELDGRADRTQGRFQPTRRWIRRDHVARAGTRERPD